MPCDSYGGPALTEFPGRRCAILEGPSPASSS
jgi:hypothetical protein